MSELNDYLDEAVGTEVRQKIEQHVNECPNCWVVLDTTKKTIQVYKGQEPQAIPDDIHRRLMNAVEKKISVTRT